MMYLSRSLTVRYFTVIYWVWVSQVFYDIRYEGKSHVSIQLADK